MARQGVAQKEKDARGRNRPSRPLVKTYKNNLQGYSKEMNKRKSK
jgi:hypothetical protein